MSYLTEIPTSRAGVNERPLKESVFRPPPMEEIVKAIKATGQGNAPEPDAIPADIRKCRIKELIKKVTVLLKLNTDEHG